MEKDQLIEKLHHSKVITLVGPLFSGKFSSLDHPHIFIDRGAIFRKLFQENAKSELYLDFSVGDGDSSPIELDLTLNPEKDFSDLSFALGLLPNELKELNLLGFLGGRKDHELINLGEIHHALKNNIPNCIANLDQKIKITRGILELEIEGTFSLVTLEETEIKIVGDCQYKLADFTSLRPLSSLGLSNEGHGKVKIESKGPFILFLP